MGECLWWCVGGRLEQLEIDGGDAPSLDLTNCHYSYLDVFLHTETLRGPPWNCLMFLIIVVFFFLPVLRAAG